MKPVVEGWSLILVGDWNSKIITAPWAKAHLARSADSEVTVVMPNLPTLPPRLLLDDLFLVVIDRHLVTCWGPWSMPQFSYAVQHLLCADAS